MVTLQLIERVIGVLNWEYGDSTARTAITNGKRRRPMNTIEKVLRYVVCVADCVSDLDISPGTVAEEVKEDLAEIYTQKELARFYINLVANMVVEEVRYARRDTELS
jgi:hypothetical protein